MTQEISSEAILDILLAAGAQGICLIDADGLVTQIAGTAANWAPPAGNPVFDSPLFAGLESMLGELRKGGEPLYLPTVKLPDDGGIIDLRITWQEKHGCFAAISNSAGERVALYTDPANTVRKQRLLEEQLAAQQSRIFEQSEMMRLFIENVPAAVAMFDTQLNRVMASRRWRDEFGENTRSAETGSGAERNSSPLAVAEIRDFLLMGMDNGIASAHTFRMSSHSRTKWKRWEQLPWRRVDHTTGGTIVFSHDATDIVAKSVRLRQRARELSQINQETRAITRAIAHDLRAPLRQIEFFSRFARDAEPQQSAAQIREHVTHIHASVERMNMMMASLTEYMHISEQDLIMQPFRFEDAIEAAAKKLETVMAYSGVRLVVGPMLAVSGDLPMMASLLERLFDNIIKYAGSAPSIMIDCLEEDGEIVIRVADDGPGIPLHQHQAALSFFQRLEGSEGVPGVGMGLPECRKIAELHGGVLALDPQYETGLRVVITLPHIQTL
ncbi:MAG: HAMP domain-containing histidine kinase [Hyphomicrobiales bacterium]|nr:HAMP domain-containing histidine kinase [Hyphomicrobiales bacterium]